MTTSLLARFRRLRIPVGNSVICCFAFGIAAATAPPSALGQSSGMVTAHLVSMTRRVRAYAQVEPISTLPLDAQEAGVISGLGVVPGMHVRAGQMLALLHGPGIQSLLLQDEANVRSERTQLNSAERSLAILREQMRAHLSTREMVHQAESAEAQAQAGLDNAQSRLGAVHKMTSIVAPVDAIVTSLDSANGELVSTGQAVITLQPAKSIWLRASYYGVDLTRIHAGMTGTFSPSDGSAPIAVGVRAISGVIGAGGGESIMMTPLHSAVRWINGEFGTVTLNVPPVRAVAVPTRALILNQGKWWLLVHTSEGDRPQKVVPGPARGWKTYILRGITPGTQVVVKNAYLLFHASITEHYQIPD